MRNSCLLFLLICLMAQGFSFGAVLLDDTWADASRAETNLPNESAVWVSHSDDLTISANSLAYAQTSSSHKLWTYFMPNGSPRSLHIGDKLIATIEFIPRVALYNSSSRNFRFGLFYDPTDPQALVDMNSDSGNGAWTDSEGYGVQIALSTGATASTNANVGKRTDLSNASLMGSGSAWTFTKAGADITNVLDTMYTLTLELDYVSASQMDVIFSIADAGGVISTHTYTDDGAVSGTLADGTPGVIPIATQFDHLFFRFSQANGTADVLDFHRLKIEHIFSEESATWASNPDPADAEIDVAIDLSGPDRTIPNNLSWTAPSDPNIAEIKGYDLYLDPNNARVAGRDAGCRIAASTAGGVTRYDPASDFNYKETLYWVVDTRFTRVGDPNLGTPSETIYVGSPSTPWSFTTVSAAPVIETYDSVVTALSLLPAALSAVVTDADGNLATAAFAVTSSPVDSNPALLNENVTNPYAPSVELDTDIAGTYEVKLTVSDGSNVVEATAQVDVYDDACAAAQAASSWAGFNDMDYDADCDVDLVDFAAFAAQWLDDRNLTAQDTPAL